MLKKIKEKFDYRMIPLISLWYLFWVRFWPLLSISRYNHSNADDYWMSCDMHFIWEKTHSLWKTIGKAWECAIYLWKTWDGCLFSMFIGNLAPVVFHEDYYKYTFSILAGSLILSFFLFLFALLVRLCKMDWISFGLICPVFLMIMTNLVPSIKDAFYWWVGGINYTLFTAVFFTAQACVIEYMVSRNCVFLILGSILSFSVGLGNLLSGLVNPVVLVLECIVFLMIYKKKGMAFLFPTLAGIVGLMINVLAPGNLIRGGSELFSGSVLGSVWGTIVASTQLIPTFYKPSMICMFVFVFAVLWNAFQTEKIKFKFHFPALFFVLSYLVYCAVFTPVIYAGSSFYGRCKNVSFFVLLAMILLNLIYLVGWLKNRWNIKSSKCFNGCFIAVSFLIMVWSNVHFYPYYQSAIAEVSLKEGQAQDFDAKVDARYRQYYDPSISQVIIEPIEWLPSLFYFDDDCLGILAYYFNKEYIRYPDGYEQP